MTTPVPAGFTDLYALAAETARRLRRAAKHQRIAAAGLHQLGPAHANERDAVNESSEASTEIAARLEAMLASLGACPRCGRVGAHGNPCGREPPEP